MNRSNANANEPEDADGLPDEPIQLANFNDQLRLLRDAEKKANEELADAIKRITVDTEEKNKKTADKLELTAIYTKTMAICRAEIAEIMFTFICGIRATPKMQMDFQMNPSNADANELPDELPDEPIQR